MASTTVYPNGDGTKTGWTGTGDASNLYANIDEGTDTPTDADYNTSDTTAAVQTIYFLLDNMPSDFDTATAVTIYLRVARAAGKVNKLFDYCQLVQSDESTAITATASITTTTTITTVNYSPSITGGTSKTIWDGARLKVTTNATFGAVYLYAAQVAITYTAAADTLGGASGSRRSMLIPRMRLWQPIPGFIRRNKILVPAWIGG